MNVGSGESGGKGRLAQDCDINLAPIIDCFTVLITFLLVSASFLSIGFLDAGASVPGQAATNQKPPAITLEVEILDKSEIHVKVSGKGKLDRKIAGKAGELDLPALSAELEGIKKKWPEAEGLVLSAKNDIEYIQIIKAMEVSRKTFPAVLLGGF